MLAWLFRRNDERLAKIFADALRENCPLEMHDPCSQLYFVKIAIRFPVGRDHSQWVSLECGHRQRFAMPIPDSLRYARCGECAADFALKKLSDSIAKPPLPPPLDPKG